MPSLASSPKLPNHADAPTRLRLTMAKSLDSVPPQGVWSRGPVYRNLDSMFLTEPQIPKAPPAPRLRIDHVNGSLRILDAVRDPEYAAPTKKTLPGLAATEMTLSEPKLPARAVASAPPKRAFQIAALATGFVTGLVAAFLFGWL